MFNAFTEDLLSFLSCFPPRSLEPAQIEQLSRLATALMSHSDQNRIAAIAKAMWENQTESPLVNGLQSILNLSSALYPLSFRPLIALLRELAADTRSAVYVAEYLEMKIMTLCESAEGYADALIALDEDEDVIWDKLRDYCRNQPAPRVLSDVRMGESMVFVQAMREIPGGTYRSGLPAGLVGVSDESFSTVAWIHPWNGFNAVVFALDTLHDLLYSDAPPSPDFHAVVEDLVESAVEGMTFLQKLCLKGTDTLRQHLCERVGVTDTIARIVAEILAMKGKANFTQEWLQVLLKAASSCLPALIGNDPVYANRVASILSCTVQLDRFLAIVSSFGETGLTVLAALASVSLVVPDETFSPRSIHSMTDFSGNDAGSGTFRELMTRLLCSGNLASSVVMSRERDPPVGWLPILWSMRVLQDRPDILLCSSSAARLFEFVIFHTASRQPFSHSDALLYPTACEAVTACLNALRYRSKTLGSGPNGYASPQGSTKGSGTEVKLTALEEVMLRPELAEAMVMLSCGGAHRLQNDKFYTEWSTSEERFLLPIRDLALGRQPYDLLLNDDSQTSASVGTVWLSRMVTRCLSLQVNCLSHLEAESGIPQIPWPSISSTLESDFCTGAVVRERVAKQIARGQCADLLRLLVSVLSCRQRAALRSLCGPHRSSSNDIALSNRAHSDCSQQDKDTTINDREVRHPIRAVIYCLEHTFATYKALLAEDTGETGTKRLQYLDRAGQLSMMIASCVKVLRIGMESQNSRWFRDYVDSDFWKLLTSLVKSDAGSNDITSFSLVHVTQDFFACKNVSDWCKSLELDSCKHLAENAERILDTGSIWKGIAADVFHIMSSEILADTTEVLFSARNNETLSKEYRLEEGLFQKPLFKSFAEVFSESWVSALLGTEQVRDCIEYLNRRNDPQGSMRLGAVPTVSNLTQSASERIAETTNVTSSKYNLLSEFDRSGDLVVPYGLSYAFDIPKLARFLKRKQVNEERSAGLILSVMDLNVTIARQDVYDEVLSSFSSMASIVLFVDSLCPTQTLALTYASPQFGGKLCRYLPKVVTSLLSDGTLNWYLNDITLKVSKLLCRLSTRLSGEELEIEALTAMDHANSLEIPPELLLSTPLGHVCHTITRIVSSENSVGWTSDESGHRQEAVSWLLLTASRYAQGTAFYTGADLQALVRCCVSTLKTEGGTSEVCMAVATALTATIARMPSDVFSACFNQTVLNILQSSVDSAATKLPGADQRSRARCMTALLLTLTRAVVRLQSIGNADMIISFRQINASGVHLLLPPKRASMKTYDFEQDERNPCHTLWCSMLQLAAVAIPLRSEGNDANMIDNDEKRHVIEFCSVNLERIIEEALDLQKGQEEVPEGLSPNVQVQTITLGNVEEAELGATVLSRLSSFGLVLQNAMPNTTRRALEQLCKYAAQAIQILRTDPIERWVRPVTQRERERSGAAMEQLTSAVSQPTASMSPSPLRRSRLTPKKSPSQALRDALGGKPWQGSTSSPGSSSTPFLSPMPATAKENHDRLASFSPASPWTHHGSGLITQTAESFDQEASKSLLRGLCAALDGIRQLSEQLGIYPFQPTMDMTSDTAGIGTLLSILKFSCWALHREDDEERRACVQGIADTAMNLTLSHAMNHAEAGSLSQSVRDEVRKRVTTTLYRARNLIPPLPGSSILLDEGLMSLWKRF